MKLNSFSGREAMNHTALPGRSYGNVLKKRELRDLTLSESAYSPGMKIAKHSHEHSYFCILLQGTYTERYGKKTRECKPSTVVFHPPYEIHENHFLTKGGRLFRCEIKHPWLERFRGYTTALSDPADFSGGPLAWFAIRLYEEFREMDSVSALAIEGLALEIVAELSRKQGRQQVSESKPPRWLKQATELLQAQFAESLVFSSIAHTLGVHPVHFARVFRQFHGCTAGEYVRRLRIEAASRKITAGKLPLVDIAMSCGFSDQSHFSKSFKRSTGLTPAQYRASFRSC